MWPAILEAKESANKIKLKIDMLLKNHNGLMKKELARHNSLLVEETNAAISEIKEETANIICLLENHKKQVASKHRFLKRHYKSL